MEPITHFLTGAALSRAGLNRTTALATVTMTLAAEAADIDFLANLKGSAVGFAQHRGVTHTFLGVPFVAALTLAVVWAVRALWQRMRKRPPRPGALPVRWGRLYGLACIAALSHLLLDFTNNYGLRPFFPFQGRWYAWDIVFIVEPVMLTLLIAGLVLPSLFGLVAAEVGARAKGPRGRGGAIFALAGILLLWGVRDYEHRRAVHALESFDYQGQSASSVSAFPYWVNPFKWYGVIETEHFYQSMHVDSWSGEIDPEGRAVTYYKPEETPASQAARRSYLGRAYLAWSRYPLIEAQPRGPQDPGWEVTLRDVRFMSPGRTYFDHAGDRVVKQRIIARSGESEALIDNLVAVSSCGGHARLLGRPHSRPRARARRRERSRTLRRLA